MPVDACRVCADPSCDDPTHQPQARIDGRELEAIRHRILERDDWTCQECGIKLSPIPHRPDSAHVGHRQARVEGGTYDDENLYALCSDCNHRGR